MDRYNYRFICLLIKTTSNSSGLLSEGFWLLWKAAKSWYCSKDISKAAAIDVFGAFYLCQMQQSQRYVHMPEQWVAVNEMLDIGEEHSGHAW